MTWGMTEAGEQFTFEHFVTKRTCDDHRVNDAFRDNCKAGGDYGWSWDKELLVTDLTAAEEDFADGGRGFVLAFGFLNAIWMLLYLKNSGLIKYSWGTIGYHASNVKAMRQPLYKYFGYFISLFLAIIAVYGAIQVGDRGDVQEGTSDRDEQDAQKGKIYTIFFNGVFQCVIGLMALISPAPDTIEYGETVMQRKINAQPWQVSRGVMEKFQDALSAARGGDSGYLKDLTNCSEGEVEVILTDVRPIPYTESLFTKIKNCLCCKSSKKDEETGGVALSPAAGY